MQFQNRLRLLTTAMFLAALLPTPAALAQGAENIVVATSKAPVVADGDVAGHPTDFTVVLDRSPDPLVEGRSLPRGRTIKVTLPDAFVRTAAPVRAPESGALTKGWTQGGLTGYTVSLEGTHTVVFTATEDIAPRGTDSPGIKVLHLRGRAFTNPAPGAYPITVEAETGPDGTIERGTGTMTIRPTIVTSINVSNALYPQPSNNNWQRTPVNSLTARPLDFLLFGGDGQPLDGVGVVPADRGQFPRYTGGLLVRDTDGDGRLDPAGADTVVGGIIGMAPEGAVGQLAASVTANGRPILSGQARLPNDDPAPGILRVQFRTGNQVGAYTPTFELVGGTVARVTVVGVALPRASDGRILAEESAATQALFLAVWGEAAAERWAQEHDAELARLTGR